MTLVDTPFAPTISSREVVRTGSYGTAADVTLAAREMVGAQLRMRARTSATTGGDLQANEWLPEALGDLVRLSAIGERWDGQAAHAPTIAAIRSAASTLVALPMGAPKPQVGPDVDGSIHVEWVVDRLDLTLTCGYDGEVSVFYGDGDSEWEGPLGSEPDGFDKLLWRVSTALDG